MEAHKVAAAVSTYAAIAHYIEHKMSKTKYQSLFGFVALTTLTAWLVIASKRKK